MSAGPARTGRVLVVDDQLGIRRFVERALSRAGFIVESAVTGSEALQKLRASRFDLLLLDLELPWLDGFEVLAAIRQEPATAHLPVIVITGSSVSDTEFEADEHVVLMRKPFEASTLKACVQQVLEKIPDSPGL